ncbi:MAG: hypothetical protein M1507_04955 [Candidatus Thermoplasmatota archaeon]|nr:hypothetical protein [Candidatus Thermoplasmatota archaeon]
MRDMVDLRSHNQKVMDADRFFMKVIASENETICKEEFLTKAGNCVRLLGSHER